MKTIKYLLFTFAAALITTSCYEDKGSYDTSSWTDIISIEGADLLIKDITGVENLIEDELLVITPKVKFREGVSQADFEYCWVLGGDTIGREKNLSWQIKQTPKMLFSAGLAHFWFAIKNSKTGENWRHYSLNVNKVVVKVKINPVTVPQIGVIVYSKQDKVLEWASIKGSDKTKPTEFNTVFTDMYKRYNEDKPQIVGDFVGATLNGGRCLIYTNNAPDYGAMIQTSIEGNYPMGVRINTILEEIYGGAVSGSVISQNFYTQVMQDLLIDNALYVAHGRESYQFIIAGSTPSEAGVAQVMGAKPFVYNMHFAVQRATDNKLYYYTYRSDGYARVALTDGSGAILTADKIIGVFRNPTTVVATEDIFVVTKEGSNYFLNKFVLEPSTSALDKVTFQSKKDVTTWADRITEQTTWFTNPAQIGLNYLFIVKGKDIWRTSYMGMDQPVKVKTFADEIVEVAFGTSKPSVDSENDELYAAVFTYNSTSNTSSMYMLNARTHEMREYSSIPNVVQGRVEKYLPVL